jgi:2-polyprenyl-3-methyl-5-hydroxy-6-metoxy-1,4-benzoquinol methylase
MRTDTIYKGEFVENGLTERTVGGLHDALVQKLPDINHDTPVLDVGCGTGAWLERLAGIGFTCLYGVDRDISHFRTKNATCSQIDLDQGLVSLGKQKYGLITAIEVVEHLENPGRLFKLVSNHLDRDGYFLLTTPNIHSIACRLKFLITGKLASFDEKGDPTHIYPVLLTSLERVLPRHSLKIVNKWGYPANGSLIYRGSSVVLSSLMGMFLPNQERGDTLCLLIQKQ